MTCQTTVELVFDIRSTAAASPWQTVDVSGRRVGSFSLIS